jgi:hypothetical protein
VGDSDYIEPQGDETPASAPQEAETPDVPTDAALDASAVEEQSPEKEGFFSTALGKVVLIGCAIGALLTIVGIVGVLVFTFFLADTAEEAVEDIQQQIEEQASETATGTAGDASDESTSGAGEAFAHEAVEVADVHVWRDIFQPLLTPVSEDDTTTPTTTNGGTTTTTGGSTYDTDTLYLLDIKSGSSETAAQFYYNGIDYNTTTEFTGDDHIVVLEGDRLENTPWRLLSIGITSVQLQYGDSTVTLSVGQGIRK